MALDRESFMKISLNDAFALTNKNLFLQNVNGEGR